jgi:hypothetical protein
VCPGRSIHYFSQRLYLFPLAPAIQPHPRRFVHSRFCFITSVTRSVMPAYAIVLTALHIITAVLRL